MRLGVRVHGYNELEAVLERQACADGQARADLPMVDGVEQGQTPEEVRRLFVQMLASLPEAEFPNLRRFILDSDLEAISEDAQFEYGLQRMLDGVEADLAKIKGA